MEIDSAMSPEDQFTLSFDDVGVRCVRPDGTVEQVTWAELERVSVLTTSDGPFQPDIFWVLHGITGGCVIPWGVKGDTALLTRLQKLPHFRNEAILQASSRTTEGLTTCWERNTEVPSLIPRFIVANYGTRHAGMLLAHLQSVATSHPHARQSVYWQDIPAHLIDPLRAAFPKVDWVQTTFDFDRDPLQRISSKVLCWARAAEEHATEPALVFCDSDILVCRDLATFFTPDPADVVFTTKPEKVPLNSGVMLARGGPGATAFFRAWRDATIAILKDPAQFAQANDPAQPYGGTDQMSLYQLLHYTRDRESFTVRCTNSDPPVEARLRAEPCARLNETNSRPITNGGEDIHAIHYKGGWQRILLDGRPFSRFRPRAASWEMFTIFMQTMIEALQRVHAATGKKFTMRDFGIQQPWYYHRGRFHWPAYLAWRAKEAAKRAWLFATGRLNPGA